jgi:hypothetical protein
MNFTLPSFKIILWTFLMFSSKTAFFGRPLRASPSMHISPRFNLANHFSTADFAGPNNVYIFFLFYPSFHNKQKLLHSHIAISHEPIIRQLSNLYTYLLKVGTNEKPFGFILVTPSLCQPSNFLSSFVWFGLVCFLLV